MNAEEAKNNVDRKAIAIFRLMQTEDGQAFYKAMKFEFDPPQLMGSTVELTYFNLGRRDSIAYIDELLRHAEKLQEAAKNENQPEIPSSFDK